jgi:hypothetical protein
MRRNRFIHLALAAVLLAAPAFAQGISAISMPPGLHAGGRTTWNPSDKSPTITLTNFNLTATGTSTLGLVRSTNAYATGKYYFEVICSLASYVGISTAAEATTNYAGFTTGYAWQGSSGVVAHNNASAVSYTTWTAGTVIGVAYDGTNNKVFFAKANVWQGSANPSTNTGGLAITASTYYAVTTPQTGACSARFTPASQTYSPPTGFSAWGQ